MGGYRTLQKYTQAPGTKQKPSAEPDPFQPPSREARSHLKLPYRLSPQFPPTVAMAAACLLRRSPLILPLRSRFCSSTTEITTAETTTTTSSPQPHRRYPPPRPHEFAKPSDFLGSWDPPSNPKEAAARLDRLRKAYAKQMKQVRRQCAYEMDLLRAEKERKEEARREALRLANEQRKAEKAAAAESRAAERKAFEEELRQNLMKWRAQKLESWRAKEEKREKNKAAERDLLRQQTSEWIAEEKLESRILEAIVNTTPL